MSDLAGRLNKAAGGGDRLSSYDGQHITVVSIKKSPSSFQEGGTSVKATILDQNQTEVELYVTPTAARQLIEIEPDLPLDVKVVSFPGQFGKTGYKLELA